MQTYLGMKTIVFTLAIINLSWMKKKNTNCLKKYWLCLKYYFKVIKIKIP